MKKDFQCNISLDSRTLVSLHALVVVWLSGTYFVHDRDSQLVFLNFPFLVELPNSRSTENIEEDVS